MDNSLIKTNIIEGTSGRDNLKGNADDNYLKGLEGNDTLSGLDGNDTLEGGSDNDMLYGGTGRDTYIFSKGDGNDTISTGENNIKTIRDTIKFTDVELSDIKRISRVGNNLVIQYGDSDSITILNHFTTSPLASIQFASDPWPKQVGTLINHLYQNGTGLELTDKNDKVTFNDLDYKVNAGDGNDVITMGKGYDTLIGGQGNDTLNGGLGVDTYVFSKGDGKDVINTGDYAKDIIKFNDITADDITSITRVGNNLVINYGESDSITVVNHFATSSIGYIQFGEGYIYKFQDFLNNIYSTQGFNLTDKNDKYTTNNLSHKIDAGAGNDVVTTGTGNDTIHGGDGNDVIKSGAGHDSIIGGKGNDTLYGGAGSDTYVFSKGDGKDIIYAGDPVRFYPSFDTIQFDDVLQGELTASNFSRSGNNLIISYGDNDTITITNYFSTSPVAFIEFANTGKLLLSQVINGLGGLNLTDKNDNLTNSYGLDLHINAGAGNDVLTGSNHGNETLDGGEGNDKLIGNGGDDVLIGGKGNDALFGGVGSDTYQFSLGDGKDTITTGETRLDDSDKINKPRDTIQFLNMTSSDITSITRVGNNLVINYGDNDSVTVINHFTTSPIKYIKFGAMNSVNFQQFLNGLTSGLTLSSKNDKFTFNDYDQKVSAGLGNDAITGGAGNDTLYGEAGNDQLMGGGGNDLLVGGTGNDNLNGGTGADIYEFKVGDGKDIINAGDGLSAVDTIKFSDITENTLQSANFTRKGNNLVIAYGQQGDTLTITNYFTTAPVGYIQFGENTKTLLSDYLISLGGFDLTAKNDKFVTSNDVAIQVNGGAGNDVIMTSGGNDILVGGVGNDNLSGGAGSDTYEFTQGDGKDTINTGDGLNAVDTIKFTDLNANSLTAANFKKVGNNLVISYGNGSDTITIINHFTTSPIGYIQFGENDKLSLADYVNVSLGGFVLTDKNDKFVISNGIDTKVNAGAGNDVITTGSGDDTLVGGAGNDNLSGGTGIDTYEFTQGDGRDTINAGDGLDALDTIKFTDLNAASLTAENFKKVGNNLVITYGTQGDTVTIANYFTDSPIGFIQFGENSKLSLADYINQNLDGFVLTDKNDKFLISNGIDTKVKAGAGNDVITTGSGADTLVGGAGNDNLSGGTGKDTYEFTQGDGRDTINAGDGSDALDTIKFTDLNAASLTAENFKKVGNNLVITYGTQGDTVTIANYFTDSPIGFIQFGNEAEQSLANYINNVLGGFVLTDKNDNFVISNAVDIKVKAGAGNDFISTGSGDDTLVGGAGNDNLSGGTGQDTYEFTQGDGRDTINTGDGYDAVDTIKFTDMTADELTISNFSRVGDDLVIKYGDQNDMVTIAGYFTDSPIGFIQFGDNGKISFADYVNTTLGGFVLSDRNDSFSLSNQISTKINAGAGNDVITTSIGNDTLIGGTGNDTLNGDEGEDVYQFALGDGRDVINAGDFLEAKDTIQFTDLTADQLSITNFNRVKDDLVITYGDLGDSITIKGYFMDFPIGYIQFGSNEKQVLADYINKTLGGYVLTDRNDNFVTYNNIDTKVNAGAGNDAITTSLGNDTLVGGKGNDTLEGSAGVDTYVFSKGDGNDTLVLDSSLEDIIQFKDIESGELDFKRVGNNLVIYYGEKDSITITNHFTSSPIGFVQFGDSDPINFQQYLANIGGLRLSGNLNYIFNDLTHVINLSEDGGNHKITTGQGDDTIYGGYGKDTLMGGDGNDYLFGDAGNDSLVGGTGNDTLRGGAGNDTLVGGEGNDRYIFDQGQDVINNQSSTWSDDFDVLDFSYLKYDQLSFGQEGNNLKVFINGTSDSVTVLNWFKGAQYELDQIKFFDGAYTAEQVNNLIQAMASFNPPAMSESSLIEDKQQLLNDSIAVGN